MYRETIHLDLSASGVDAPAALVITTPAPESFKNAAVLVCMTRGISTDVLDALITSKTLNETLAAVVALGEAESFGEEPTTGTESATVAPARNR